MESGISIVELPNDREEAFKELIRMVTSAEFIELKKKIFVGQLFQKRPIQGYKFHQFLLKMDIQLVWEAEYAHYLKKGWLHSSFPIVSNAAPINRRSPSSKVLEGLYFHPYRIIEAFNCSKNSETVQSGWMNWLRRTKKKNTSRKLALLDEQWLPYNSEWVGALVDLVEVLEAVYRPEVTGRILIHDIFNFEKAHVIIDRLKEELKRITKGVPESYWLIYHDFLCFIADHLHGNKELLALLALTRLNDRERLVGKLGGAMLVVEAAQCLRRHASDVGFRLEEEMFRGPGSFTNSYFSLSRGSTQIVDGDRTAKLKFVREFGLDFGLRVRIYVEGATEYACIKYLSKEMGFVEVVDLKGAFVQKGKLAFRESLRNDKSSHIYSLIVLDSDVSDNTRVVKKAAESADFLGEFYVSKPDFEFANFGVDELINIVSELSGLPIAQDRIAEVNSAKAFFNEVRIEYPTFPVSIGKGEAWGEALVQYALKNPKSNPLGLASDRLINQILRFCSFVSTTNFSNDLRSKSVDPITGRLVAKPHG